MDTNVAIDYISGILPEKAIHWLDIAIDNQEIALSAINKIEILGFKTDNPEDIQPFKELVLELQLIYLTDAVINQTIVLRKQHKIKLPDAIIAATAINQNITLLSRNEKDFKTIKELKWQNLHSF
jgi:hypothetical protein